ncbi:hypothetical protein K431DRAFT_217188 [Polychaeton citri CBS 116435]|uniref:Rhodopsin domain-containing protein n=1 Tax=Polychaeton citri CBS 116435 TaxID=1314669 RepID=A0A9P4QHB5_9PEZI|nr:hypothetical protein K431DRAFT_217188 [Polychaeton citri CBS 116435]
MGAPSFTVGWVYHLEIPPHKTDAGRIIAVAIAFSALACLSVLLRFLGRWKIIKKFDLDDYAVASSAIIGVGYTAITIYQTRWGLGLPLENFPHDNAIPFSKVQYAGGPTYCIVVLGFKITLLASYLRVAGFHDRYANAIYAIMALVTANQVIYAFLLSLACRPIAKQWDPLIPGHCINQVASYFGSSLGFDLIIIALPFPILRRLQLSLRKKIIITILFALGFFVTVIQIIRIQTIAALINYTDSERLILWSIVEINLGVFIACVPAFAPLVKVARRKLMAQSSQSNGREPRSRSWYANGGRSCHSRSTNTASNSLGTKDGTRKSTVRECELDTNAEDEVALWALQPGKSSGWVDANVTPVSSLHLHRHNTEDEESNHPGSRPIGGKNADPANTDILVLREVSVTRE